MADETRERLRRQATDALDAQFCEVDPTLVLAALDALDAAEAERDAARVRVAELEATVARVEALAEEHERALVGQLTINGMPATATERGLVEGFGYQIRAALSPAQDEED